VSDGSGFYDGERELLRDERRQAARRNALLIGIAVLVAAVLAWVTVGGGSDRGGKASATTSVNQRAIADGEKALADWGQFAVSNDLRDVKDSFWANGPQFKQLAKEAKQRQGEKLGPPPYKMTMTAVKVSAPRPDQRVLRGRVEMTRPGSKPQTFHWEIWLQQDPASDGRWRLWTVRNTAAS
jgi:hypothetical protein